MVGIGSIRSHGARPGKGKVEIAVRSYERRQRVVERIESGKLEFQILPFRNFDVLDES